MPHKNLFKMGDKSLREGRDKKPKKEGKARSEKKKKDPCLKPPFNGKENFLDRRQRRRIVSAPKKKKPKNSPSRDS